MTSLTRAKNGDWFSRKGIPVDVRDAYREAFGVAFEERFRRPATMPPGLAKAEFHDWEATISSRIESLRAARSGSGVTLTQRQIVAVTGDWYTWFVARHSEEPGRPEDWDNRYDRLMAVYARFGLDGAGEDVELAPGVKKHVHAAVMEMGLVPTFLAEAGLHLQTESLDELIEAIEPELVTAFGTLRRRAAGDYSPDVTLTKFTEARSSQSPAPGPRPSTRLAGLDCWEVFERWVKERQPATATINRWRSVFLSMNEYFGRRDITSITADEAVAWKDTLVTEERSAQIANDTWLRAAGIVFKYAAANRLIPSNPFEGVKIALPKRPPKVREREFTEDEWKTILKATTAPANEKLAAHNAAARRWIPWLCAYTGSRPGEMTQLRKQDVQQRNGIWVINITPDAGSVKGQSARTVPLHGHLIEQGFISFVTRSKDGPLFYDPDGKRVVRNDPTNPGQPLFVKARGKLANWVRDLGVTDPNISPNHAWRHTFKRRAARAGIEKRIRFAMCGHSSDDVGDAYETPTVEDMAEAMKSFPRYEV